jgi:4-hydroxy-tetrahydrodipicolinate synthase
MFSGSFTAMITPFKSGKIDWQALDNFIEWQITSGTHGLVACGTTAESPTLLPEEHKRIVERSIAAVKKRVPLIIGTGFNCTQKTIEMTAFAKQAGADAALIVTPYYNKPTQEGLYAHYHTIAGAVDIPIIIYNIPGRSAVDMSVETMGRLSKIPNIIGVKDATGDLSRIKAQAQACGKDFCQLSGEDMNITSYLEEGGDGCISVTSNAAPELCANLHNAWQKGDTSLAKQINKTLKPLHEALFYESSPQPVKYACSRLGFCSDEMRLPMVRASEPARKAVDEALDNIGLLSEESRTILQSHG